MSRIGGYQDSFLLKVVMPFAMLVIPGLANSRFPNADVMPEEENISEQSEH